MATPSSNFQSILDAALDDYLKHTGIDLTKHPSSTQFQNCHSPDDVIQVLQERGASFKDYREMHRKLIDRLRPASGKPLVYFFVLFMLFCAFISEKSKFSEKAKCF